MKDEWDFLYALSTRSRGVSQFFSYVSFLLLLFVDDCDWLKLASRASLISDEESKTKIMQAQKVVHFFKEVENEEYFINLYTEIIYTDPSRGGKSENHHTTDLIRVDGLFLC